MRHTFYLGLARPAVLFGVPMVPLFLMGFACFFLALWTVPYLGLIGIPLWFLMYRMSKKDDFVFRQIGLYLKLTLPASANKKIWGNCISLSPSAESKAVLRILVGNNISAQ